jgi:hypothetical protein
MRDREEKLKQEAAEAKQELQVGVGGQTHAGAAACMQSRSQHLGNAATAAYARWRHSGCDDARFD